MYCHSGNARTMYAVNGENAITGPQVFSTFLCLGLGLGLTILSVVGLLVWMGQSAAFVFSIGIVILVCCVLPVVVSSLQLHRTYKDVKAEKGEMVDSDETVYKIWQTYTVSKPKEWYCWLRLGLDIILLFLYPLISMFVAGAYKNATTFLVLGFFSFMRIYFDASWILSELGSISNVDLVAEDKVENVMGGLAGESTKNRDLFRRARASEVMGKITRSRALGRWMWIFGLFALLVFGMLLQSQDVSGEWEPQGTNEQTMLGVSKR
jgi:hypothetical protein